MICTSRPSRNEAMVLYGLICATPSAQHSAQAACCLASFYTGLRLNHCFSSLRLGRMNLPLRGRWPSEARSDEVVSLLLFCAQYLIRRLRATPSPRGKAGAGLPESSSQRYALDGNEYYHAAADSVNSATPNTRQKRQRAPCAAANAAPARGISRKRKRPTPSWGWPAWCGRWDLNPYVIQHTPLKRACLPIPALPHIQLRASAMQRIHYKQIRTCCQAPREKKLPRPRIGRNKSAVWRVIRMSGIRMQKVLAYGTEMKYDIA